jgi:hypothetical protein
MAQFGWRNGGKDPHPIAGLFPFPIRFSHPPSDQLANSIMIYMDFIYPKFPLYSLQGQQQGLLLFSTRIG